MSTTEKTKQEKIKEYQQKYRDTNRFKKNIYKLFIPNTNLVYIGMTNNNLNKRLSHHINDHKRYKEGKRSSKCASYEIVEYSINNNLGLSIELIEKLEDENATKKDLLEREKYHIENNICINKYHNKK